MKRGARSNGPHDFSIGPPSCRPSGVRMSPKLERREYMAKLLIYPSDLKISTKTRKALEANGYILIVEERAGSVRVLEPLPEIDVTTDNAWLLRTMSRIIMNDESYDGTKARLAKALLTRIKERTEQPQ